WRKAFKEAEEQVKHASGLNNSRRDTQRWLAPIQPHLLHLAAASSASTSLVANLKHITVTLATWDAVWEVSLDPKWARQRLRLYGAHDRALEQFFKKLEEEMAEVAMQRHGRAKQLVVFFGAATIGTRGGWGADAVLWACCKVVCRPRGTDQRRGRVVLVEEHRTSRVSSAVNGQQPWPDVVPCSGPTQAPTGPMQQQAATQPAASEPGPNTPLPAKRSKRTEAEQAAEPSQPIKDKGKTKGMAAKAKPAPQPGRWLDRDCNAALNMQRIGESRWRPLELCYWPEQGKLPTKGKEYPGLGYKWLQDKPPKAQQQQQQPAVAQPRGAGQRRGRVVLVDEHRTSRVSSAVNGQQPCEEELDKCRATRAADWKPPAGQVEHRLVRPAWSQQRDQPVRGLMWCPAVAPRKPPHAPCSSQAATQPAASEPGPSKAKGKAAKVKPPPQPGRWLDRDCNTALNMQRIGESRWRPLELCFWPDQGALPAKGKEYPGLGYKRLRPKPPRAQQQQQQQQQPAEAQ
ncbi:hypothetical protein QJQ45_023020, partial [Haematococcus lacustris]